MNSHKPLRSFGRRSISPIELIRMTRDLDSNEDASSQVLIGKTRVKVEEEA